MPGRLPKRYECHRVDLAACIVRLFGITDFWFEFGLKKSGCRLVCLEHYSVQEHLAAVCPHNPYRSNLPNFFAYVQIRGATQVHTRVGKVDAALGVVRELFEEVRARGDDLVLLAANFCHTAR